MNITPPPPLRVPVWDRTPDQVAYWSCTLNRVVSIRNHWIKTSAPQIPSSRLSPTNRDGISTEMSEKQMRQWISFQTTLKADSLSEASALEILENYIEPFPEKLKTLYRHDFSHLEGNIQLRINRLVKDIFSALHLSIKESSRGNDGVLLLRHTRGGMDSVSNWIETSVIKWTTPLELISNDFLRIFLDNILVPQGAMIDFKHRRMIKGNTSIPLSSEESEMIKENLTLIRSHVSEKATRNTSIMIAERINGANLADFIISNWEDLQPLQKAIIFRGIGQLTLVDLLMGNRDRFVMFDMDFETLDIDFEANIGNFMIEITEEITEDKKEIPILYAIDNEIQYDHLPEGIDYEAYNEALGRLLSNSDWTTTLSTAIINGLKQACRIKSAYFEETQENREQVTHQLTRFVDEIQQPDIQQLIIAELLNTQRSLHLKFRDPAFLGSLDNIHEKYRGISEEKSSPTDLYHAIKLRIALFLTTLEE